ncbi:MAG: hypothetical protein IJ061_06545 [Lachnospiraceae bacterium]|nr:hypothetical protein [Lachnospiraceae bacterium]
MFNDIAYLCKETILQDEYLNEKHQLTPTEVFVQPRSIGTREFYHAATTDYHPEVKLILADYYDYDGQQIVMYDRHMFDVIRTYRQGNRLELTLQERMGKPEDWMWDPFDFLEGVVG